MSIWSVFTELSVDTQVNAMAMNSESKCQGCYCRIHNVLDLSTAINYNVNVLSFN